MSRLEKLRVSRQEIFSFVAIMSFVMSCAGGQGHVPRQFSPLPPQSSSRSSSLSPPPQAYLLCVGPPDLRFESATAHAVTTPTEFSLAESSPPGIAAGIPSAGNTANATNNSSENIPMPTNTAPAAPVVMQANSTPAPASSPALNFGTSGADPSIVTSAMLADYLKPSEPAKNSRGNNDSSPAVVVPVNLGFTPPTPTANSQSQAVYKNE